MDNLEVFHRLIQFIEVFHHVADAARTMPLTRVLVVQQAHSCDVLNREGTLLPICVVIGELKNAHVRVVLPDHLRDVVVIAKLMFQESVTGQHLGYAYGAAPAYIAGLSDLDLPHLSIMQAAEAEEGLDLLDVLLQEWSKVSPVAQVEQAVEGLIKLGLYMSDLLRRQPRLRRLIQAESVMKERGRQMLRFTDIHESVRGEHVCNLS